MTRTTAAGAEAAPAAPAPRRARGRRWWPLALVLLAAGLVLVTSLRSGGDDARLQVVEQTTGEVLAERDVASGERFELRHVHSVTDREVIETFSVDRRAGIALEELWFDEHGANLPTGSERIGETTTTYEEQADGSFLVRHHGHVIGTLPLLVGSSQVDHRIAFTDGEGWRLLDVARSGARVEVRLEGSPG